MECQLADSVDSTGPVTVIVDTTVERTKSVDPVTVPAF